MTDKNYSVKYDNYEEAVDGLSQRTDKSETKNLNGVRIFFKSFRSLLIYLQIKFKKLNNLIFFSIVTHNLFGALYFNSSYGKCFSIVN